MVVESGGVDGCERFVAVNTGGVGDAHVGYLQQRFTGDASCFGDHAEVAIDGGWGKAELIGDFLDGTSAVVQFYIALAHLKNALAGGSRHKTALLSGNGASKR